MHPAYFRCRRPRLQGWRILIVEDEPLVARLLKDEILEAGAGVIGPAGSVEDALLLIDAAAVNGGLNAAVLDINLDGAVVLPVADHLASLGVPFLFATGYGESCDRGLHTAMPVLAKPFGPHTLLSMLSDLAMRR
jgi:DNA-binding response OmpR family regulator